MPAPTATRPSPTKTAAPQPKQVQELRQAVEAELLNRKVIQDFVKSQLREGVDYGTISIGGREAKPTLFKPGMEKIFSLFRITSQLRKDEETLSMISAQNVIAYKCELYRDGTFIGEGRGACAVAEKGRVNDAIKIAEKRARMDACLNLGFSEYFTQDLEDLPEEEEAPAAQAPRPSVTPPRLFSDSPATESLSFRVTGKEELRSQGGNPYARLATDKGTVIAFRNTMDQFQPGSEYIAPGTWEKRGDSTAFLVTAASSQVRQQQGA